MNKEETVIFNRIIRKLCDFGNGETEFHTRDVQFLVTNVEAQQKEIETVKLEIEKMVVLHEIQQHQIDYLEKENSTLKDKLIVNLKTHIKFRETIISASNALALSTGDDIEYGIDVAYEILNLGLDKI